jgi:hypothetical protein
MKTFSSAVLDDSILERCAPEVFLTSSHLYITQIPNSVGYFPILFSLELHHLRQIHHPGRRERRNGAHDGPECRRYLAFSLLPPPAGVRHVGDRDESDGSDPQEHKGTRSQVQEPQQTMVATGTAPRRRSGPARIRLRF